VLEVTEVPFPRPRRTELEHTPEFQGLVARLRQRLQAAA
jgi:hypothetical protein